MLTSMSFWSVVSCVVSLLVWGYSQALNRAAAALINPDGSPSIDESVTRPILNMVRTCSQLCERIYARAETLPTALEIDGWKFDRVVSSDDLSAVCGVVFRDDGPAPTAILVFRGTNIWNRQTVRANARAKLVEISVRVNGPARIGNLIPGKVHEGLKTLFLSIDAELADCVRSHVKAGRKVYVTGHSQGGALAAIACAAMRSLSWSEANADYCAAGLITFGAPRTGDEKFARYVAGSLTVNPDAGDFGPIRFRNNNDVVPLVPTQHSGYRHVGQELYIWPNSIVTQEPAWPLRLLQHVKPLTDGILGDGIGDHRISQYVKHLAAVRIVD